MIVCFDIGGSTIKGALVDDPQKISPELRIPTPGTDFEAFVLALQSVIAKAKTPPQRVSISIAGFQHPKTGLGIVANIPCLHGRPIAADLEKALSLPVTIANDADCFAIAEAEFGAGAGHRVVFGVILGTGVGGGLVIDGQLINKNGGYAGEWGHGPVAATMAGTPPATLPRFACGCGLEGCIDATCGARGLEKIHRHIHGIDATSEEILKSWHDRAHCGLPDHRYLSRYSLRSSGLDHQYRRSVGRPCGRRPFQRAETDRRHRPGGQKPDAG